MHNIEFRNRAIQVAAAALLTWGVHAYANDCAGGMDVTGNGCNGDQAVQSRSEADSHLLQLQGAAAMASLRLERARQRQSEASVAVKDAEEELKTALKAVSDADKSTPPKVARSSTKR